MQIAKFFYLKCNYICNCKFLSFKCNNICN